MGETRVLLKVYGTDDKAVEVEALVDTGATFTKIPEEQAIFLGLQARYETEVELADGRRIGRKLALTEVELEGVRRPVLVAIGGKGEKPLVGYTTLEILGFKVNPLTGKLEKTAAIEYAAAVSRLGSHANIKMPNGTIITIPRAGELKVGLLKAAIKRAGLTEEEFLQLL